MYRKLIALIAVLSVLAGVAFAHDFSAKMKMKLLDGSSKDFLAVVPVGDNEATVAVEMLEATSEHWVEMSFDSEQGYWQAWSVSDSGFALPVSFRLTSEEGEQVIMDNVMNTVAAGAELETAVQFERLARKNGGGHNGHNGGNNNNNNGGNNNENSCSSPITSAPTQRATSAPTQRATSAPTQRATSAPTQRATQKPTSAPATQKPTSGSSSGSSTTDLCAITPTSQEPVKILVPLYSEPGSGWDSLVTSANAGASIIAIINPDNGPVAKGPPSNWVTAMTKMNNAKVDLIGYVATGYAANSITSLKSQIDTYASKYNVKGIFLDEVSNQKSDIPFYQQLHDYIMAKPGFVHNILNPGTSTDQGYLAVSTSIVIYESSASSFKASSASWVKCAPNAASKAGYKYKFSGIAFGASQSTMTSLVSQMANSGMGLVYITDDVLPNPYDPIPSYWSTFANTVKGL